jgi:NhaA family Na+:H+ antiporter
VHETRDHILGPADASITLVEYGSYACPNCRAANEAIADIRDRFGDDLRYVFRHRPVPDSDLARRAAELVERATDPERFWDAHVKLMTRSASLTEADLQVVAADLGVGKPGREEVLVPEREAAVRVDADIDSARASGVVITPTFFINERRYLGPWDHHALEDAILGRLGYRIRLAALEFMRWAPSAGALLLIATLSAILFTNSPVGPGFLAFWETSFGLALGDTAFRMSLHGWVNDGFLTIFFLVVGLEIKREFTVGYLASPKSAALPIAAALGGMVVPALLYLLVIPSGPWSQGWGVPMATDTAFAVALIALMGSRVPVELRVFLTAAAIVDDIGAILVIAIVYSADLQLGYLVAAGLVVGALFILNRVGVYFLTPYLLLGAVLWALIHAAGVHATLAGVILALVIPTRPPANLKALMAQANTIIAADARHSAEVLRHGPSLPALEALDAIHDRLESPAARLLRHAGARSSFLVLPLFALANAGVVLTADVVGGHEPLMLAIIVGLVLGKPLGMLGASALAARLGLAIKPDAYSWGQVAGAGALAGIGFTMSLFVAGQAFPDEADFVAAKIAVFAASVVAALIGVVLLWLSGRVASSRET